MKKLKSSLVLVFGVLIMSTFVFDSCKKDDLEGAKGTLINSKWVLSSVETDNDLYKAMFDLSLALVTPTYEFKKDGTYEVSFSTFLGISDTDEGTWSISDDGKELTIDNEVSPVIELTNKVLRIGASKAVMGDYTDDEDADLDTFTDYEIVFDAK